jgi:hypothetical protein
MIVVCPEPVAELLFSSSFCRRGETTYAMGWLKLGPN